MFGKGFELFKLFGFSVKIDLSWLFIAVLVTWTLASGVFPTSFPGLRSETYWAMAAAGMLGLFLSIVLHELSHSLVARRHGMQMKGITLFIFGGVAEMSDEPPSAKAEFWMAIAGPIASVVIALVCFGVYRVGTLLDWPAPVNGVFAELAWINAILVAFNLVPAFPLDGGRVLRALIWQWKGSIRRATQITSQFGVAFGITLIVLGVLAIVSDNFVAGMWYVLIGLFLRGAAQMSYQQLLIRRALEGESIGRFMTTEPVTVAPELPIARLVEDYIYHYHYKMFPVVENGKVLGCVTTRHVRDVPRDQWPARTVKDIVESCSPANTISPTTDAMKALAQLTRAQASRAMVVDDGKLVGMLSLKDMMQFLSTKIELEGEA